MPKDSVNIWWNHSDSESSDTDSVPEDHYDALIKYAWLQCEFCGVIFDNRYSLIKHNAGHIIIPLIKQTHQCTECLRHFHTEEFRNLHDCKPLQPNVQTEISSKIDILENIVGKQVLVKCEDIKGVVKSVECNVNGNVIDETVKEECDSIDIKEHDNIIGKIAEHYNISIVKQELSPELIEGPEQETLLEDIVQKQVLIKCEDKLRNVLLNRHEVSNNLMINDDVIEPKAEIETTSTVILEPVRNRLLFEDEDEDDMGLMHNLPNHEVNLPNYKVNLPNYEVNLPNCEVNLPNCKVNLPNCKVNPPSENINTSNEPVIIIEESKGVTPMHYLKELNSFSDAFVNHLYPIMNDDTVTNLNNESKSLNADYPIENDSVCMDNEWREKTVHYQDLIQPQEVQCKHCRRSFPNRFHLIEHEAAHIGHRRFRYSLCPYCETYIAGNYLNLRAHIDANHPSKYYRKFHYGNCNVCKLLYFNKKRHFEMYHCSHCSTCLKYFETGEALANHGCRAVPLPQSAIKTCHGFVTAVKTPCMQLCEFCYTFMKTYLQNRWQYILIGELSKMGVRQKCDKCSNKFFVVYLLKRKKVYKARGENQKKVLSNEDRLKRVQQRLKMIQHRNKF